MKTQKIHEDSLWELWNETPGAPSGSLYENDLEELHRTMGVGRKRDVVRRTWLYVSAAAALLVLVMVGEYGFLKRTIHPENTMAYVTSPSAKGEFTLPDGSHVWLNSSSSLTFDKSNPRQVQLEGEGFFDVAKKNGEPFVVSTGTTAVKVLGTRFNVRSSDHFEREEVSLISGKVEITAGDQSKILAPGERAAIGDGAIEKTSADVSFDASWIGRELVFDNAGLSDILLCLEHWYNVNILVAPGVNMNTHLSFKVRKESLEETEHVIGRITGLRFKSLDEKSIMITVR